MKNHSRHRRWQHQSVSPTSTSVLHYSDMPDLEAIHSILATDCGSTTTKAILIEKQGDTYRQTVRGEAPTTVEAPFDDVTVGVQNAVREVEELSGRTLIGPDGKIILRGDG